jgi:hypothetical protein
MRTECGRLTSEPQWKVIDFCVIGITPLYEAHCVPDLGSDRAGTLCCMSIGRPGLRRDREPSHNIVTLQICVVDSVREGRHTKHTHTRTHRRTPANGRRGGGGYSRPMARHAPTTRELDRFLALKTNCGFRSSTAPSTASPPFASATRTQSNERVLGWLLVDLTLRAFANVTLMPLGRFKFAFEKPCFDL